jgi:hypothetical protein
MVTRYDESGRRLWNVSIDFTMQGKFVNAESKVDESVWRAPGRESKEALEREMTKLMAERLMQGDIAKALVGRQKIAMIPDSLSIRDDVKKALQGVLEPDEERKFMQLIESIGSKSHVSSEWGEFTEITAKIVKGLFGVPESTKQTGEYIKKIFGEIPHWATRDVFYRLIQEKSH